MEFADRMFKVSEVVIMNPVLALRVTETQWAVNKYSLNCSNSIAHYMSAWDK